MVKKLLNAILLSALSAVALAQSADIGYPPANATVYAGKPFAVEIDRPVRFPCLFLIPQSNTFFVIRRTLSPVHRKSPLSLA